MPDARDELPLTPRHPAWTDDRWRAFCAEDRRTGGPVYRELIRLIDDRVSLLWTDRLNTWPARRPGYDEQAMHECLNQNNGAIRAAVAALVGDGA